MQDKWQLATKVIHAGHEKNETGALVSPLCQSATFVFDNAEQGGARFSGDEHGYIYTRLGNPTTAELERKIAALEGSEAAAATASGMAAVSAALLANLKSGDHLVASNAVYGCTFSLMNSLLSKFGIEVSLVNFNDRAAIIAAIRPTTKVIFCETPVNPHLDVYDLNMIASIAKQRDLISIVDNTFMTPLLQQPIKHGIDIVVHSATKYLNGHGDVIAGLICASDEQMQVIKYEVLKDIGSVLSPHDAWLILRGLKTLDVRIARHCENAEKVALFLEQHPKIAKVYYPGLKSHAGHALLGGQMRRAGGVIAFELVAGYEQSLQFINQLSLFSIAVSLGDAESLIQHPASMTHSPYTKEQRELAGITDNLLRISVGLESAEDIIQALADGLARL
ncbi:trans-sulfuration enzyme family protein [Shewanella fidelis]|uniref:Aminotransferase class I/II-fold pyridoxal phosphate-dependent enzyme n=1 Tax=Shewanella fidelis TaxID=173509 RepID=A0AAW8NMT8_9GAMM|nr:aminotransferase class I/II-fold pyridoxal phosphate-dependent enzyme [Shewanella fidelis]MDR8523248.1 aminotransferase class I/II-fold pyridoxal phosphate-dependent enzyme [Shewanella fidelis]MDW4811426.1 aminotransferase class I/II-fold pyridoxal phosphate-dependent enzyme [Shewanella fidelis]MDW4815547.1 aminotransferase class I/II-fold pyridoxal phosphate-dependent enzyme [Shewanella fidelis]MDW4819637.1 aminotransferase class I/II-fold pyridoxal phosphate-dependent enzyme [Shewanella fi